MTGARGQKQRVYVALCLSLSVHVSLFISLRGFQTLTRKQRPPKALPNEWIPIETLEEPPTGLLKGNGGTGGTPKHTPQPFTDAWASQLGLSELGLDWHSDHLPSSQANENGFGTGLPGYRHGNRLAFAKWDRFRLQVYQSLNNAISYPSDLAAHGITSTVTLNLAFEGLRWNKALSVIKTTSPYFRVYCYRVLDHLFSKRLNEQIQVPKEIWRVNFVINFQKFRKWHVEKISEDSFAITRWIKTRFDWQVGPFAMSATAFTADPNQGVGNESGGRMGGAEITPSFGVHPLWLLEDHTPPSLEHYKRDPHWKS